MNTPIVKNEDIESPDIANLSIITPFLNNNVQQIIVRKSELKRR